MGRSRMSLFGRSAQEPLSAVEGAKIAARAAADVAGVLALFEPMANGYSRAMYDDEVAAALGTPGVYALLGYLTQTGYLERIAVPGNGTYYRRAS
jgi:hypothetical protein